MKKNNEKESRRNTLKKIAGTTALTFLGASISQRLEASEDKMPKELKGRVNHSVCRWCYNDVELEDLCKAAKEIGLTSIELVGPEEWPMLKKYGLTSAMPWGAGMGIEKGFNNPDFHDELVKSYEEMIPKVAAAGFKQIICFSGNRKGLDDQKGIENCAMGLKRLMPTAEKHGVIICMELLNSKVNHKDYQADHTAWGVEMCKAVGSENIKLLYDVYHMQIMEGDVIATINKFHPYISHYHTGGVPGRNEIDETQELYYPAIMKAIVETGYTGFVGQEFIPKRSNKLASLKQGVEICDV
ncbi:hydroxypyruvate isomerase family protein [Algoriphagus persicinus]|uniref:hydroxypyruvate isomerase family protein n=1 Tax=Algoriphagus persicinus TaxID=3108754 RepID=UPI002B3C0A4B|nr:TIM barrel protein [Algoriphagus sp. E1-3-M2]MEB2787316.1 TIM barrel protein [Algoriphagus sp. E1-3-M2]